MPYYRGAAAFVSSFKGYQLVRLADIERTDITEQQGNMNMNTVDTKPAWPVESTPNDRRPDQQSGPDQQINSDQYNWRVDLTDNTYRYDKRVELPALAERETPASATGNLQPIRALTHWMDEIHGKGGEATRGRQLADSPISHYNSWERVPTHPTYDTPSGVYDGGGASAPETPMETCEWRPGDGPAQVRHPGRGV